MLYFQAMRELHSRKEGAKIQRQPGRFSRFGLRSAMLFGGEGVLHKAGSRVGNAISLRRVTDTEGFSEGGVGQDREAGPARKAAQPPSGQPRKGEKTLEGAIGGEEGQISKEVHQGLREERERLEMKPSEDERRHVPRYESVQESRAVNFSACMEAASISVLNALLDRELTEDENARVQDSNRSTVPDRDFSRDPREIRMAIRNVLEKAFEPFGYSALPKSLNSAAEVVSHLNKKEPVLLVFPVLRGADTHISHVTRFDGTFFYTNDERFTFRPPEMETILRNSVDLFRNEFNAFVVAKPPPFPGGN
jgi:hypothetical protein